MKNEEFLSLKKFSTTLFKDFRRLFFSHMTVEGAPFASLAMRVQKCYWVNDSLISQPVSFQPLQTCITHYTFKTDAELLHAMP